MNKAKKNIWIFVIVIVLILTSIIIFNKVKGNDYQTITVERKNLEKITEISGKVVPAQEIDLSFENRGKITSLYKSSGQSVRAGELIAEIDASEVSGEINEALANLRSESAKLNELSGNGSGISKIDVSKNNLIKTLSKAYVDTDETIRNKIDPFFERPDSRFPEFSMTLSNYFVRKDLNEKRVEIEKLLQSWKDSISTLNINNFNYAIVNQSISNLKEVESFISIITDNAYDFQPVGDVTKAQIDAFLANVGQGRSTISSDMVEINTAVSNLRNIESEVPVQSAKIENYQATVSRLESKIGKYVLIAPFDGIITSKYVEVGEIVEGGESVFSVISNLPLQVETYVPEINIIGINVGDKVKISFDAFGSEKLFEGVVSEVEPKETIKDGIVTYKVIVDLLVENPDLKPGMSANLKIVKEVIESQIITPTYVVFKENDLSFVNLLQGDKLVKTQIEIIDNDNRGNYSVSGISEGDLVVIPIE
jgi:RND family efflux transporter MFP subunit